MRSTGPDVITNVLCVDVNCSPASASVPTSLRRTTHREALLHGLLEARVRDAGGSQEVVHGAIDLDKARPPQDLAFRTLVSVRTTRGTRRALTEPVQKRGQSAFSAVPLPWLSHVERYGERTASGTEAGLNGVAVHDTAAVACSTHKLRIPTSAVSMVEERQRKEQSLGAYAARIYGILAGNKCAYATVLRQGLRLIATAIMGPRKQM